MYLKSIDIAGFKSFAEPTEINLEPGITGVVGPNGCGKTNVSESIRWSLGELSAKSLRTKALSDIIFNGTRRLSPASQVSVTLNFNNEDRALGMDTSEVSVTRKAYRDGASEYYINKTPCRLKDIRNLFRGTGLGEDGYSIMEGRMVEFLLSAKPQDRRLMFDEASGAAKFAARRDETLNKLARIEQDLNRVQDNIALLNTERKHLEDQAKKAILHEKLVGQKKALEAKKYIQDLDRLQARLQEIKDTILEPKSRELETQSAALSQIYAQTETLKSAKEEKEKEIAGLSQEYHAVIRERDVTLANLRHAETNLASLKERLYGASQEKDAGTAEKNRLAQDLEILNADAAEKETALLAVEAENPEATGTAEKIAKQNDLQNQVKALKDLATEASQRITAVKNEIISSTMETSEMQIELRGTLREHRRLEEERALLENTLREIEEKKTALEARHAELKSRMEALRVEEENLRKERQELEEKAHRELPAQEAALKARLEHSQKELRDNPQMTGAKALLDSLEEFPGVYGPISRLMRCPSQYYPHLKSILGDRLNWFLAENADAASRALNYLRDNSKGRATFILLDKISDKWAPATVSWQQAPAGETSATTDLEYVLDSTDARTKKAIFYLLGPSFVQGTAIYCQAVIQGGQDWKTESENSLSALEEMEGVQKKLEQVSAGLRETLNSLAQKDQKLLEITAQISSFETNFRSADIELAKKLQDFENKRRDLDLTHESAVVMERESQERLSAISRIKENAVKKEEELKSLESQLSETIDNLKAKEEALETAVREAASERETQLAYQLKYERAKKEAAVLAERRSMTASRLETVNARLNELERTSEDLQVEVEKAQKEQASLQEQLKDLNSTHQIKADELAELQKFHDDQAARLLSLESQQKALELNAQALKDEINHQEVEHKALEIERTKTIEEAARFFEVAQEQLPEKLAELRQSAEADGGAEEDYGEKLARINERLSRLGAVNFLAHEEFERLQERTTFLETQKADILAARDDVKTAILKINEQIAQSFTTTFTAVREKFREIFSKLFEGGEADLALTNPEDLTQCGVEIYAQPPGKKLQSITLLSQGEKALTAVSLLFAFFATKPSPVCVLDEIDAPLDENNVGRFCKMLKEFSKQCQFIIITHNKKTMAIAHTLYGVTMEELGVSKIISVKLEEVAETLAPTA